MRTLRLCRRSSFCRLTGFDRNAPEDPAYDLVIAAASGYSPPGKAGEFHFTV